MIIKVTMGILINLSFIMRLCFFLKCCMGMKKVHLKLCFQTCLLTILNFLRTHPKVSFDFINNAYLAGGRLPKAEDHET